MKLKALVPYAVLVAVLALVTGLYFTTVGGDSLKHHKNHKSASSGTPAAVVGFRLANRLNSIPPTTNRIIGEVACIKTKQYACLFIGNNRGTLYCAVYKFDYDAGRVSSVTSRVVANRYCGL